ncbi:putative mediator of RNA polymerase II transcription subunit 26 [Cyclospora cayetanensis]|uniref:Mediator of RNA polymerase II transcription subunit 26 n=1 Tax=Cyclospora cayetanensis TaxID=88456 RepID=A0A6P6RXJ0_9EIME|nr:putative mediator of RNA polymerase II transcription subunit 26 [Cyclospora cayetanensis]
MRSAATAAGCVAAASAAAQVASRSGNRFALCPLTTAAAQAEQQQQLATAGPALSSEAEDDLTQPANSRLQKSQQQQQPQEQEQQQQRQEQEQQQQRQEQEQQQDYIGDAEDEVLTPEQREEKERLIHILAKKLAGPLADEHGNVPTGSARPIAIEVDGPSHFYSSSCKYTAYTKLKHRLLTRMGYKVLHVPYFEWRKLRGQREREEYMRKKLMEEPSEWLDPEDEAFYNQRMGLLKQQYQQELHRHQPQQQQPQQWQQQLQPQQWQQQPQPQRQWQQQQQPQQQWQQQQWQQRQQPQQQWQQQQQPQWQQQQQPQQQWQQQQQPQQQWQQQQQPQQQWQQQLQPQQQWQQQQQPQQQWQAPPTTFPAAATAGAVAAECRDCTAEEDFSCRTAGAAPCDERGGFGGASSSKRSSHACVAAAGAEGAGRAVAGCMAGCVGTL